MSKISVCLFIACFATAIYCSPTPDEDSKPGYCHDEGIYIKEGDAVPAPIGKCYDLRCEDAKTNSISSLTCPAFVLPPGSKCHVAEQDLFKQYPECCDHPVCPDDE